MGTFNYTTVENDRWDSLAYKFYSTIKAVKTLTDANPTVALTPVIPMGTNIVIPIIDDTDDAILTENLPPWKK